MGKLEAMESLPATPKEKATPLNRQIADLRTQIEALGINDLRERLTRLEEQSNQATTHWDSWMQEMPAALGREMQALREQLESLPILDIQDRLKHVEQATKDIRKELTKELAAVTPIDRVEHRLQILSQTISQEQTRLNSLMQALSERTGKEVAAIKRALAIQNSRIKSIMQHLSSWRRILPLK